jgi:protease-4
MFGCLTSVALVFLFIIMVISSLTKLANFGQKPAVRITDNSVLHFRLTGAIPEFTTVKDMNFNFSGQPTDSLHDIILKIRAAKDDSRIRAILLQPQFLTIGYANINELISAINDFKTSGKKVYGYVNMAAQQDMLLLSVADEVYMNPSASAGIVLHGIGGSVDFYKNMFDKLGLKFHIVRAGEYKSAGEQLTRTSMSPQFRRNMNEIFGDLYNEIITDFASNNNTSDTTYRSIIEQRDRYFINQENAKTMSLVNELAFFETFLKRVGITEKQLVRHTKYTPSEPRQHLNRIAVVYMLGNIVNERPRFAATNAITSSEYIKIFDDLMKDDSIRAVVIRVSSGGGSALESEIIYAKIEKLKEKKPVIVSFGNIAASGGYYIAANANYIFADPYTITGSIGVFGMIPDMTGTAEKIGITSETIGHGKFVNAGNPFTPFERSFEVALQRGIDDTYIEFKTRVASGRNMTMAQVENIAKGKIFAGRRALQHNLVDYVGQMGDAIDKAAQMTFLTNYSINYYPTRRSFMDVFMQEYFDINVIRNIVQGRLPQFLSQKADNVINVFHEIENDPIQMRKEFILDIN